MKCTAVCIFALLRLLYISSLVEAVPEGFVDEGIAFINDVMDLLFFPSPGPDLPAPMMVVSKNGELWMIFDPDNNSAPQLVLDFDADGSRLCTDGSRGLMSAIPHPDFGQVVDGVENRWLYIFYGGQGPGGDCSDDPVTGGRSVVSRFQLGADYVVDVDSEERLLITNPTRNLHLGGDIEFGMDGNLWITIGDGGEKDIPASQFDNDLAGCLVRITDDGGIPPDNPFQAPFFDNTGRCAPTGSIEVGMKCEECFATGIRSPYRFARDMNADYDRFFIMDVGSTIYEEVNEAGIHMPGVNYGWPNMEGPCNREEGWNNLDCSLDATVGLGYQDPVHWYARTEGNDVAAVGGAFIPRGVWPSEYDGHFIFSDYPTATTYDIGAGADDACRECENPRPNITDTVFNVAENANAFQFGPYANTQALYYSQRINRVDYNIRRVRYAGDGNLPPVDCGVTVVYGDEGSLVVDLEATATYDPDGDDLTFVWTTGAPGGVITSEENTETYTYPTAGSYSGSLRVSDGRDGVCTSLFEVQIGRRPTINIISPAAGTLFYVDEIFTLNAEAFDGTGARLPDTALSWEMRRHHNTHYHPWMAPTPGNMLITDPSPPPEDLLSTETSYMEILVTATDSFGLTTTETTEVWPKLVDVDFEGDPSGVPLPINVFDVVINTPARVQLWDNQEFLVKALNTDDYTFVSWSDDGAQEHYIRAPSVGEDVPVYVATYRGPVVPTASPTLAPTSTPTAAPSVSAFPTGTPTMTPVVAGEAFLRINAGGNQVTVDGETWVEDTYFGNGRKSSTPLRFLLNRFRKVLISSVEQDSSDVPLVYTIDVPNGRYIVDFVFADPGFFVQPGSRVFDVVCEGEPFFMAMDIADGGGGIGPATTSQSGVVDVFDGTLNIELSGVGDDKAKVNGISIINVLTPSPTIVASSAPSEAPTAGPTFGPTTAFPTPLGSEAPTSSPTEPLVREFYGCTGDGDDPSNLYHYDLLTDVATLIGTVTYGGNDIYLADMAFDRTTGILYACSSGVSVEPNSLFTIDTATAAATFIGALNPTTPCNGLSFDSSGQLYGWGRLNLITIDKTSGAVVQIDENTGPSFRNGLAFDDMDTLYLLERDNLFTVNKATSERTPLGENDSRPFGGNRGDIEPGTRLFFQTERVRNGSVFIVDVDEVETISGLIETGINRLHLLAFQGRI